jgi:hypothetical protein
MNIDEKIVTKFKSFDWDFLYYFFINKVSHIKGNQYNFWRGSLMEHAMSTQDKQLIFVGKDMNHQDYQYKRFDISLELKTTLKKSMYSKHGKIKPVLEFNLTNLRSERELKLSEISDIILVVMKDGAFIVPKEIAFQNLVQKGNQFNVVVSSKYVVEVSGKKTVGAVNQHTDINDMIRDFSNYLIESTKQEFNLKKGQRV